MLPASGSKNRLVTPEDGKLAVRDDVAIKIARCESPSQGEDAASVAPSLHEVPSINGSHENLDFVGGERKLVPQKTMMGGLVNHSQTRRVTGKDLDEHTENVLSEIETLRHECAQLTEESAGNLRSELAELDERVERLSEKTEEHMERVGEELSALVDGCNARTDQETKRVTIHFDEQLTKERESYQALNMMQGVKLAGLERRMTDKINAVSAELSQKIADLETRVGSMVEEYGKKLEDTAGTLRTEIESKFQEANEKAEKELADAEKAREEQDRVHASQIEQMQATFMQGLEDLDLAVQHTAMESRTLHNEGKTELFTKLTTELSQHDQRLSSLEGRVEVLALSVASVGNLPTRRIDWCLHDVSAKAFPSEGSHTAPPLTWRSVDFDVAGVNSLRLELRHLPKNTGRLDKGDCIVLLWAPKGLFLIFKLLLGDVSVQLEHSFVGDEPFTSDRLCFLRDQVNPDDDSLRIGIEVLESVSHASDTRDFRKLLKVEEQDQSIEADMYVHRYLNHRVLELVQDRVDTMSSRMVRRIEWRIEQASSLRKYFQEGESICSSAFDAASLHDLQFVFYPFGYAGARDGYCSLFLYCPDGSLLKCWLSLGKMRKEVRLSADQQGYLGRTNFCRFDSCMEADDSILLALEIVEAQRFTAEALVHQVSVETPRTGGSQHRPPTQEPEGSVGAISSVMRMQQTSVGRDLEDVRLLPSIWTASPPGNICDSLDGFHNFNAIKAVRRPLTDRRRSVSAGGRGGPELEQRPRTSRAAAARRYDMYVK